MVPCTRDAPGTGNGGLCACQSIPPELAPSPSGVPILWLEVLVDSFLYALVFYYVKGWGERGGCAGMYV